MRKHKSQARSDVSRAFTLIELLVVIAIIALLIGIAVPSISTARTAAKKVASRATIKSLAEGCEAFNGEFSSYPKSDAPGGNPFSAANDDVLSGAQWLTVQLSGPDFEGYVDWRDPKANARGTSSGINHEDWQAWYGLDTTGEYKGLRVGPYIAADSNLAITPEQLEKENPAVTLSSEFSTSDRPYNSRRVPFYRDNWGNPILYYAANVGSPLPFSPANGGGGPNGGDGPSSGAFTVNDGIYDQEDNRLWTGTAAEGDANESSFDDAFGDERTDLGARKPHQIRRIGYVRNQRTKPDPTTFAGFVYDESLFEQTLQGSEGKIRPFNPETFIMISAGADQIYGTKDDVKNFGSQN